MLANRYNTYERKYPMPNLPVNLTPRIEAQRIYLGSYKKGDGGMYSAASLRNHEHLQRYESGNSMMSIDNEEQDETVIGEYIAGWTAGSYFVLGVFDKATDAFVAQVYVGVVDWELPEFEVGYIADVDHQEQGYVTEAVKAVLGMLFGPLMVRRVSIHCRDSNLRSQRVAEGCGFRLGGHIRENKGLPDGNCEGDYCYGLLKSDYDLSQNP
jgi:RimJ/RimL family protein N-acetyltransferase